MKDTRRSLLTSAISLLLCFVMLLGTTFAWFTDIAVSEGNVIQAGSLDIELMQATKTASGWDWQSTDGKKIFDYDKWEPGYTTTAVLGVQNNGNLSAKWTAKLVLNGTPTILADVIEIYVTSYKNYPDARPDFNDGKWQKLGTVRDILDNDGLLLPGGQIDPGRRQPILVALHMREDAGNEYQGLDLGANFNIVIMATQASAESDSFGSDYDTDAKWPEIPSVGNSASASVTLDQNNLLTEEVTMTSADGKISATLPAGTKLLPGTTTVKLVIADKENSEANLTLDDNQASLSLDVHVTGIADDNDKAIKVELGEVLPTGLNMGNYDLYHVEDGQTNIMTLLDDTVGVGHNTYAYDPANGEVVVYMASFSEVALVADTENAWNGEFDYDWYNTTDTYFEIANADQLAAFGAIVGGMKKVTGRVDNKYTYSDEEIIQDSFSGKTVKLIADINLGDKESENNPNIIFYPIGYWNNEETYERKPAEERKEAVSSGFYTFNGTFDGNGHTVSNFYQNTWEMKGDHNWYDPIKEQYYRDGMGLFGRVYGGTVKNLTVENFSSDGEITTTGVIAAYADGATFENIAIFKCNPRVYNIGNGGIVGCVGWYAKEEGLKTTFTNITVDNSNKISALWGSYDVACGGIVGQYYPTSGQSSANYPVNAGIHFDNCHVSAVMDVYNDVCANYQYYAYRYTGMLIGSVRENVTIDGHSYPKMDGITASGCTVHFGTWNDYYYCEIIDNTTASYTHDYQMSRLTEIKAIDGTTITYLDGTTGTVPASGRANYVIVDYTKGHGTENATCYHFKDGAVWTHDMGGIQTGIDENGDGQDDLKEDKQHIYLEFNNLVTGYGWGVTSKGVGDLAGVTILDRVEGNSVEKFEGKVESLINNKEFTLGDIFTLVDSGVKLVPDAITVGITNLDENGNVVATIVYDSENWANTTISFAGSGTIQITIQDYYFCIPTTIEVEIINHGENDHVYDNNCDADCNVCGAERTPGEHVYDNECDENCNECGASREVGEHTYDNACDTTCNICGAERTITHTPGTEATCTTAQTCTVCGETLNAALGHTEVTDSAVAATCTTTGLTEGKHCSVCNEVLVAQTVVEKLGHTPGAKATCTTAQICTVCGEVLVKALGHSYNSAITNPTCTTKGYTTHTCENCNDTYTDNETEALGHVTKKFTSDKFTYRIGNQNAVALSSLFDIAKHTVTISGANVSGNASVEITGTSLKFNGTGVIKVTLSTGCSCGECELELDLEVVEAYNTTGAQSTYVTDKDGNVTFAGNVVLLQNASFSSLEVSGGYTLYGNGFTLTCGSDSYAKDLGYSFVTLNNGTLDNVQIVTPNFDYAALYKGNLTSSDNRSHTDSDGTTRYYNARSGVMVSGNSQILNSRISGARAAVNVTSGNCIIDNSRLEGGAVASLLVGAANSVTLRDVTLVQKPTASTYDSSKKLMGFSVLMICNSEGKAAPITLEGNIVQNAWVDETDNQYVPSAGQSIVENALKQTDFLHDLDGDKTNESLNLGFAFMPETASSPELTTTITDNRVNKNDVPYGLVEVSNNAYVYSYKNTNGTDESFKTENEYIPNRYSDIVTVSYSDTTEGLSTDKSFGTNGWVYELNVDLDKASGYQLDFSRLSMVVNGVVVTDYKVNGSAKPTSPVAVVAGGTTYVLTATVNGKEHTATFKVTGTETTKESPSLVASNYAAALLVGEAGSTLTKDTWHGAAPVLEGIQIKYWSVAEKQYKTINLSDYTPTGTGKQNGTNTTWTYTPANGDFTLTITGGQVHSSNKVSAIPVVCGGKLYFVAATSNGLVNYGNDARTIPVTYSFKDNNGGTELKFAHNWSIECANGNTAYDYSEFMNGTSKTFTIKSSNGNICVTADTLVTLADGSKKRIDQITYDDQLLVWNFFTGEYDIVPSAIIFYHGHDNYDVLNLHFDDGTIVKVLNNHGFYDVDSNQFVFIDENNANDYIGHSFVKVDGNGNKNVKLVGYEVTQEYTGSYSIQTAIHNNFMVEDMFSITMPHYEGWFDYFEIGEGMKYDEEKMQADIEKYGLYTYDEFAEYVTYEQFIAFNGPYLKVLVGRGVVTYEQIIDLISMYVPQN